MYKRQLDYCDAIFYVHIAEKDAIDEGVIPELPKDPEGPTDEDNYTSYSGILTFEDLWPEQGDYDMNDVMIRYTSKAVSYTHLDVYKRQQHPCDHHPSV